MHTLPKQVLTVRLTPRTIRAYRECRVMARALAPGATVDDVLKRALDALRRQLQRECRQRGIEPFELRGGPVRQSPPAEMPELALGPHISLYGHCGQKF
jgi:hypothetical protein